MRNKIIISILIMIGVCFLSYNLIESSASMDTSLSYENYVFKIEGLNNKIIHDLFLSYNFEQEEGYFKFRIGGAGNIDILNVDIPKQFNLTSVKIFNSYNQKEINFSENLTVYSPGGFSLKNLGTQNIEVLINLTSINTSFQPNGRFKFNIEGASEVTLNDDFTEKHSGVLLEFYFGDKYRCLEQCFIIEKPINENITFFPNQKWLLISSEGNAKNIGNFVAFSMNTYNLQKKINANLKFGLGIGLLSSIIASTVFFFLTFFLFNNNNNGLRKKNIKLQIEKSIFKSLKEELTKISNKIKIDSNISRRLNEIEQEINLGTFDNIVIASMFLIIAMVVSILLWSLSNYHKSIFYLMIAAVLLLFLYNFSQLTLGFLNSIIFKDRRFTNKINVITILLSLFLFITLIIVIPFGLEKIFISLDQNNWYIFYPMFAIILVSPIIFGIFIRPKITKFFVENFPNLFLKRLNKMNKEQRNNALKKIKKTLPELKELARKY